jgi:hypothetical protein
VFTPEDRERVRERLLDLARTDERITGAALTGSAAHGEEDRWSDVDVFLGVGDGVDVDGLLAEWTELLYGELEPLHHWDMRSGPAIYRVFLLPGCLQVDLAFTPASDFGARGPTFRVVFGNPSSGNTPSCRPSTSSQGAAGSTSCTRTRVSSGGGCGRPSSSSRACATKRWRSRVSASARPRSTPAASIGSRLTSPRRSRTRLSARSRSTSCGALSASARAASSAS